MTPSLRAALPILAVALVVPACAEAPPPMTPAQPAEPPPNLFGPGRGTSPVDEQMLALVKAEDEIDKLFPNAGKPPPLVSRKAPQGNADKAMDQQKGADAKKDSGAGQLSSTPAPDPCSVACRALESMRTSADRLCKLAGEGDGRCDDARGRVRGASARVRSVCPECPTAAPK